MTVKRCRGVGLRRHIHTPIAVLVLLLLSCASQEGPDRAGDTTIATSRDAASQMTLTSTAFAGGGNIPAQYSFEAGNTSPPLAWTGVPASAVALALVLEDPNAIGDIPFVHWTVWDFPAESGEIPAGSAPAGGLQGSNSAGTDGYMGPDPPRGETHRYVFTIYALSERLDLVAGAEPDELEAAIEGKIVGEATLTGLYPGSE